MAGLQAHQGNNQPKAKKPSRRSRKKRRTEDFSSSSEDSSSDSELENAKEEQDNQDIMMNDPEVFDVQEIETKESIDDRINIDNLKHVTTQDNLDKTKVAMQTLKPFEDKNLTESSNLLNFDAKVNYNASTKKINEARDNLLDLYLSKTTVTYFEDLDELRQQKDFNNTSLVLLAKLLKESGNIFDDQALKSIVKN